MSNRIDDYFSKELIYILDTLPGRWIVYEYCLVHHGWIAKISQLDKRSIKDSTNFFLHSEEGYIDVSESNRVDSPKYVKSKHVNEINDIIEIMKAQIK